MLLLFGLSLFLSATLLFVVQPMFARMALPYLGGTPAVWNTCCVFYQAVLLAGYAYAHGLSRLSMRTQIVLHSFVLLVPLAVLPISIPPDTVPPSESNPVPWLLALLSLSLGLPFFAVSTSAPLLQRWFARTGHVHAGDPYFLYAASNAGSMLALLAYPLLIEPMLRLAHQTRAWTLGYAGFVLFISLCGIRAWRSRPVAGARPAPVSDDVRSIAWRVRLRWIALAAVPSSLLLGVTMHISTDIAAVPMLWVLPLALYLLTFILVFARNPLLRHGWMLYAHALTMLAIGAVVFLSIKQSTMILVPLHLAGFFLTAMVCHGELAASRPSVDHLTEFYLWMSVGGVLGGLFSALAAPLLFTGTIEYEIALVAGCLLRPSAPSHNRDRALDGLLPLGLATGLVIILFLIRRSDLPLIATILVVAPASLAAYSFVRRPVRFGLSIAGIIGAGLIVSGARSAVFYSERTFFGVYRVKSYPDNCAVLVHGSTVHGAQHRDPLRMREPLTYYHRGTLVGALLQESGARTDRRRIAIVGLGVGTLAAYGEANQQWDFFEIDPAVERMARNRTLFTYLSDCPAPVRVLLGDARLTLERAPDAGYDILVLDAFSSDAIPLHLITREALALYVRKVSPNGLVAFHVSNRYFDLQRVVGALARAEGLEALVARGSTEGTGKMEFDANWVLLARRKGDLGALPEDPRWMWLEPAAGADVWTDDFSNLVGALRMKGPFSR